MMRVSVIVPAFNASSTIRATLDSVISQTVSDFEIFIVDDGSSDDTASIAEAYAKADSRIQVIRQANAGVASARNAGLMRASGDYVAWLDADDIWHPTKLEKQLAVFEKSGTPLSFVYTGYRLIDEEGRIQKNFRPLVDVTGQTYLRQMATHHFSNVSSLMAPRELAQRIGGHDPRLRSWGVEGAEDLLMQLRLAAMGPVGCVREALVGYRMHRQNMSHNYLRSARSNLKAVEIAAGEAPPPRWVLRLARARSIGYALHLLAEGSVPQAIGLSAEIVGASPRYSLVTLAMIAKWQLAKLFGRDPTRDPEVGAAFLDADPSTAPWNSHIALFRRHYERLVEADASFAQAAPFHRREGAGAGEAKRHAAA